MVERVKIKDFGKLKEEAIPPPPNGWKPARPRAVRVQFHPEIAEYICEQMCLGRSMTEICEEPGLPDPSTVCYWATTNKEFFQQYTRSQLIRADRWSEELTTIADDARNDYMDRWNAKSEEYDRVLDREHIARSSLRIDTRKWLLARIMPKRFGDATMLKMADSEGNNLPPPTPTFIIQTLPTKKRE